jgi:hypothetical protein
VLQHTLVAVEVAEEQALLVMPRVVPLEQVEQELVDLQEMMELHEPQTLEAVVAVEVTQLHKMVMVVQVEKELL